MVWTSCTIRIPKGIDENGNIIWDVRTVGMHLGGATFHFSCEGAGRRNSLCAYRKS